MLFDTSVVDVTDELDDPLSLLLSVQLGGDTDIAQAVGYCEDLIQTLTRTVFSLISDFYKGGSSRRLLAAVPRFASELRGPDARSGGIEQWEILSLKSLKNSAACNVATKDVNALFALMARGKLPEVERVEINALRMEIQWCNPKMFYF